MKYFQKKKTVFCAMSGGVDSSVAAALLKKRGFNVIGVFMRNWHPNSAPPALDLRQSKNAHSNNSYSEHSDNIRRFGLYSSCPWEEDQKSARVAASAIGIPFYTWDFSNEYKERVVDYMVRGYHQGLTPNPDVVCNKEIKFGVFLEQAIAAGADFVATGHYVRMSLTNNELKPNKRIDESKIRLFENSQQIRYSLMVGIDPNKDQSYFLWTLTQAQLKYCLFPIGDYTKPQVREIAKKFGLPNAERKDSQGLCFVGKVDFRDFIGNFLPKTRGKVLTTSGKIIGEHEGTHFYTVGQRRGIGIGGGVPHYVAAKDAANNTLVVADGSYDPALYRDSIIVSDLNWISGSEPKLPLRCLARIRYRQPLQWCTINQLSVPLRSPVTGLDESIKPTTDNRQLITVVFDEPQKAVAPGQSIVFYKNKEMLGGGVIQ
jgi:tRNA-specific 2-thiouridylase